MLKHEQRDLRSRIAANEGAQQALGMAQAEEGGPGSAPGDVAGDLAEETLVATLVRADRTRLADVEAALYRIAAHQYGRCVTCGHPIGYARLYVLPWTSRCRVCAGRMRTGAHDTRDAATH